MISEPNEEEGKMGKMENKMENSVRQVSAAHVISCANAKCDFKL